MGAEGIAACTNGGGAMGTLGIMWRVHAVSLPTYLATPDGILEDGTLPRPRRCLFPELRGGVLFDVF